MSKNIKITVAALSSVILIALSVLPIMSVYSGGELVGGTFFIKGYDLMEFSPWGCMPILAALLIPVICLGCQSDAAKEAELLLLFVTSVVGYLHGFQAAQEWLEAIGDTGISYHIGLPLWPASCLVTLILASLMGKECSDGNV